MDEVDRGRKPYFLISSWWQGLVTKESMETALETLKTQEGKDWLIGKIISDLEFQIKIFSTKWL